MGAEGRRWGCWPPTRSEHPSQRAYLAQWAGWIGRMALTKAGKPSPIRDIRYFDGGSSMRYIEGCGEAVAFGRRVSRWLGSKGYSLGSWHHLYLCIIESDQPFKAATSRRDIEWWYSFIEILVPIGFSALADSDRNRILIERTQRLLVELLPDHGSEVEALCQETIRIGQALQFPLTTKRTKFGSVRASFNIPLDGRKAHLLVTITSPDGQLLAAPVVPLRFYSDADFLVGSVSVRDETIVVSPRKSFRSELITKPYGPPLVFPLGTFQPCESGAVFADA